MNRLKSKHFLMLIALALGCLIATSGHWIAAVLLVGCVANALTPRSAYCWDNNFGTLATATIIQEALDLVFTVRPLLNNVSLGFRDENGVVAQFGQQVITRTLAVPTVGTFGDAAVDVVTTDVPVTLNLHKQIRQNFTLQQISSTSRDLVREQAMPIAIAIANHMTDAIAALWTVANFPVAAQKTVKGAGWDYAHLLDVRGALVTRGVPQGQNKFYAANVNVYKSMLQDPLIVAALNNPSNGNAIATGKLPRVADFGIDEYPALPANAINLVGFAGTPDSCVYASRVPRNPESLLPGAKYPGNLGVVTNPRSGLSVMVFEWIDAATGAVNVLIHWMYGVAKGNTGNGQLVTSQ